jgi:hypothetical protein
MLLLQFIFIFSGTLAELKLYNISETKNMQFYYLSFFALLTSFFLFLISLILNQTYMIIEILKEPTFWILFLLLFIENIIYKKILAKNNQNNRIIMPFLLLTIPLVFLFGFFLDPYLGFQNTIQIEKLNNINNVILYSILFLIPISIYLFSILKQKKLNGKIYLFFLILIYSFSIYLEAKNSQIFSPFVLFFLMEFFLFITYFFIAFLNKQKESFSLFLNELKTQTKHNKTFLITNILILISYLVYYYAFILFAVEFFVILRRISQIISGVIIDKKMFTFFESFLIISMLLLIMSIYIL